jgi:hypothetical protein
MLSYTQTPINQMRRGRITFMEKREQFQKLEGAYPKVRETNGWFDFCHLSPNSRELATLKEEGEKEGKSFLGIDTMSEDAPHLWEEGTPSLEISTILT